MKARRSATRRQNRMRAAIAALFVFILFYTEVPKREEIPTPPTQQEIVQQKRVVTNIALEFEHQELVRNLIKVFNLDVDEYFFYGMMYVESRFSPEAVSPTGAQGILQIMPETWDFLYNDFCENYPELSKNLVNNAFDKHSNITLGIYYIKLLQTNYGFESLSENSHAILTMYNFGPNGADEYYKSQGTYVTKYSQSILRASEYIRKHSKWKEGL